MSFDFEKLDVYKKAILFCQKVELFNRQIGSRISPTIKDQLLRASLSIPLNIAEGNGRWHFKEKRQFLNISKGSINEIVPIIQLLNLSGDLSEQNYREYYHDLENLSKMIARLIQSLEKINRFP